MRTLICVPMFNEADTILEVLHGLISITDADILVVDDGSTDGSLEAIRESGLNSHHIIRHRRNLGYGFALRTGFRFALDRDYDQLITFDSDGQHLPEEVLLLLEEQTEADVVTGSRFHPESPKIGIPPAWRLLANQALTEMVHQHTGYSITDSACGLRVYRRSALSQLRITEDGYICPYELWGQMARLGLSVSDVPVTRLYKSEGQPTPPTSKNLERMIILCERVLLRELRGEPPLAYFSRVLKSICQRHWHILRRRYNDF